MARRMFFATVASATFFLGLVGVRAYNLLSQLEAVALERLLPTPDFSELFKSPQPLATDDEESDEVYAALVRELFLAGEVKLIVIKDTTNGGWAGAPPTEEQKAEYTQTFLDGQLKEMPEAQAETLIDYLKRDERLRAMRPLPGIGVRQVLVSDEEVGRFFPESGVGLGWTGFYLAYPDSPGVITFSSVGFNSDRTQAFVYIGVSCGGLCGQGGHALLQKRGGKWAVVKQVTEWVS